MKTPHRWIVPLILIPVLATELAPAAPQDGREKGQKQQPAQRQVPQRQVPQRQIPQRPTPQPQRQIPQRPTPQKQQPKITPRPTVKPRPSVAPDKVKPVPPVLKKPDLTPGPGKDKSLIRPDRTPGKEKPMIKPTPDTRDLPPGVTKRGPGSGKDLLRPDGTPAKLARPGRPALVRPADKLALTAKQPAALNPALQKKWGGWGKWDRTPNAKSLNLALINNNYQRSLNWSYRPAYWGARPWWTTSACHNTWHHGHWNYGWGNSWHHHHHWYYPSYYPGYTVHVSPFAWGLAAWGLGSLFYDSGYYVYSNPYLPVVPYSYGSTIIRYDRPITVIASDYPTGDEDASALAASRSAEALERSRSAFRNEDYLTALKDVDEAISFQPGDSALHEYRALVLFSLGKYGDAAGVLNPVLASGPGWDRDTMVGLYREEDVYLGQLAKLERYVAGTPDQPAPRFLLGYHYLVGGDLDRARGEFDEVVRLQPSDGIARQLRDLTKSSVKSADGEPPPPATEEKEPAVEALSTQQLVGKWTSNRAENGIVTLDLRDDGSFTWNFKKGDQNTDLAGTYEIDDRGLLVLSSDDAQMVGEVKLPSEAKMTFILAGGPEGDPGLSFDRLP